MEPILSREASHHGYSHADLRRPEFVQPARGVSMLAANVDDLASRCRAIARVLPADAVFTHLTSARLRGWWLPRTDPSLVIACTASDAPHLNRRGVFVRRCAIPTNHRQRIGDLALASPAWTIVELAEHFSLLDLVIAIDSALHGRFVTIPEIWDALVPGRRGVRVLRQALPLCDARSESPWETILRLLHVMSGIEVEPQAPIHNQVGVQVARADLRIKGTRRLAEYDGADHRDRAQHERDLRRDKLIARSGHERFGYIATEIMHQPERVVADAEEALGLAHVPGRLAFWKQVVTKSSLTNSGNAALARRLDRFSRTRSPRPSGANATPNGAIR